MTAQQSYTSFQKNLKRQHIERWMDSPLGQILMQTEQHEVNKAVTSLFGYHLLQIGNVGDNHLFHESRIKHKVVLDLYNAPLSDPYSHLQAEAEALPFASDSLDVVLLPHTLEFSDEPHQILREVQRVLIGEGHIVIISFNPWSLWGIWKRCVSWRDQPPWNGRFFSQSRIKDWLELLGFELITAKSCFLRPPIQHAKTMNRIAFVEKLAAAITPFLGAVSIIVAKKKVEMATPIKMQWKHRRHNIAAGLVGQNTRQSPDVKPRVQNDE